MVEPCFGYKIISMIWCNGVGIIFIDIIFDQKDSLQDVFDQLDGKELQRGRSRSNPFETLGKLFFQNRAALKMANMDAVFDFMFTKPKNEAKVIKLSAVYFIRY